MSFILIIEGKNKNIFPTYLPIGHIVESERGNKQYFDLGLRSFKNFFLTTSGPEMLKITRDLSEVVQNQVWKNYGP
jgi:hypothetical protein